jgi:hypothetical protein
MLAAGSNSRSAGRQLAVAGSKDACEACGRLTSHKLLLPCCFLGVASLQGQA